MGLLTWRQDGKADKSLPFGQDSYNKEDRPRKEIVLLNTEEMLLNCMEHPELLTQSDELGGSFFANGEMMCVCSQKGTSGDTPAENGAPVIFWRGSRWTGVNCSVSELLIQAAQAVAVAGVCDPAL
jgi:hypothetical protein